MENDNIRFRRVVQFFGRSPIFDAAPFKKFKRERGELTEIGHLLVTNEWARLWFAFEHEFECFPKVLEHVCHIVERPGKREGDRHRDINSYSAKKMVEDGEELCSLLESLQVKYAQFDKRRPFMDIIRTDFMEEWNNFEKKFWQMRCLSLWLFVRTAYPIDD